jgi:UDP-N-acetylmuramyl pentapeptide synthase
VRLVVVSGSIGKTYAKIAIATVLSQRYRVRLFHGNRGTNFTAPLAILGIDYPGDITGFKAWRAVFKAAKQRIKLPADVDVIVLELNSASFGALRAYADYIIPDIALITAISESNLEVFQTLDYIAQEQLSVAGISRTVLINRDDIDGQFAQYLTNPNMNTYGTGGAAEYRFSEEDFSIDQGYKGDLIIRDWQETVPVEIHAFDDFSVRMVAGAAAVGVKLGLSPDEVAKGVADIRPLEGRTNPLRGVDNSLLLDNTSNNSPLGSRIALQSLYQVSAPQRIAVFGTMQHLAQFSTTAHQELGMLCDPAQLAWVVTVGDEANKSLASAARQRGCQVKECKNALEAGAFVHSVIEDGAVVLFDGPEDGVFLEEAIKVVLHSTADEAKLVRQSPGMLQLKAQSFSQFQK